ncbi:ABC transporter substrate-binding protein [Inediibacterium massiliense]|uniref:ABC transporter substrate-binding protein n=1 Tax=Inediibacterium massiliense TaxID=1658111 RepID=UPI0006B453CC|nr:extracellular solute-binding protein [Inediibacterium massiliense]
MENKKNKGMTFFLCFLICAFLIFGPFYFLQYKLKSNSIQKEENFKGVIEFWDYPHLDCENGTRFGWILEKIRVFEKQNPGVYIDFKPIYPLNGPIEIETSIKTNSSPDIAPIGSDQNVIHKKVLEPLDQYLSHEEWDDYKEESLKAVTAKGRKWGIPWMIDIYKMYINVDLFHEKNIEIPKNGEWTYKEFVDHVKQLTYDQDGDKKIDTYGFYSFVGENHPLWGILLSDGATIFEKDQSYGFDDEKAISGLKKLVDLKYMYKVTPDDFGENSEKDAWDLFCKGKVAVYPAETSKTSSLKKLKNEGGFEFEVVGFPIGEEKESLSICTPIDAYGIFKQEDPKKLEMCVKFLKFITKDDYQRQLYRLGVFPAKKSIGEIYKNDPYLSTIENELEDIKMIHTHPKWRSIEEILQSQIRQALLGKKSSQETIKDSKEKIKDYMESIRKIND